MNDFPDTSASLIASIRDSGNADAWRDFERVYRPVIFRIARAKGLQYADAFDLTQQVLVSVSAAIDRYQVREGGPPFRNWLSRITRNAILKAVTRKPRDQASGGTEVLDLLSDIEAGDEETKALIQLEYRREIFKCASEQVRDEVQPATWLAFELSLIQGRSMEHVAKQLNLSVGNVYAARSRVMKKLKETVRQMELIDPQS